jgi:hypothetical protein
MEGRGSSVEGRVVAQWRDMVAQWIERQIAMLWSQVQSPASLKLGLVAKSCNTATRGQEYLDVDGGPGL